MVGKTGKVQVTFSQIHSEFLHQTECNLKKNWKLAPDIQLAPSSSRNYGLDKEITG